MRSLALPLLALATLSLVGIPSAWALEGFGVSTTDPVSGNNPSFANVGYFGTTTGSAIYLGSSASGYWVLTAAHVVVNDSSTVGFLGNTYNVVAGSAINLTTTLAGGGTAMADLRLFRVNGDAALAGLSSITIASSAPTYNSEVTQIGYGGNWDGPNYPQYTRTWGNTWVSTSGTWDGTVGDYTSKVFQTTDGGTSVKTISGDSGGAMFIKSGTWKLAGLMQASDFQGTAQGIDLSAYRTQINSYMTAVPEPSTYALMVGGAGLLAMGVRRRRRRAAKVA